MIEKNAERTQNRKVTKWRVGSSVMGTTESSHAKEADRGRRKRGPNC